jgi:predicted PurR-regulated permease PerM
MPAQPKGCAGIVFQDRRKLPIMSANSHSPAGTVFTVLLLAAGLFVAQRFLLPLLWAGVLCVATWPLYRRLLALCGMRAALASAILVAVIACLFVVPAFIGLQQAIREAPLLAQFIADANSQGIAAPAALKRLPLVGDAVWQWWQVTLAQPHGLAHIFSEDGALHLHSTSTMLRHFGGQLLHRLVDFGFALLCLFFFYKNGEALHAQIAAIGMRRLGPRRWGRYHPMVPVAIRATVNGLVLVGLAEGLLIGIGYALAGLASAALWAAATGILAIIPFGAPVIYLSAAALLAVQGHAGAAVGVALWGSIVLFAADHLVRPNIIGNATRLPFLAVLFGILGGVEMLGLVGLFVGPVIMALVVTLWREAAAESGKPVEDTGPR